MRNIGGSIDEYRAKPLPQFSIDDAKLQLSLLAKLASAVPESMMCPHTLGSTSAERCTWDVLYSKHGVHRICAGPPPTCDSSRAATDLAFATELAKTQICCFSLTSGHSDWRNSPRGANLAELEAQKEKLESELFGSGVFAGSRAYLDAQPCHHTGYLKRRASQLSREGSSGS